MHFSQRSLIFGIVIVFFLGFFSRALTWRFFRTSRESKSSAYSLRTATNPYTYINPLLGCETTREIGSQEVLSLKKSVSEIIAAAEAQKKLSDIGIYYRDLNSGQWFGIHHDKPFAPASLFKVPVLIAYLRLSEINPGILQKRVFFQKSSLSYKPRIVPDKQISLQSVHTVSELFEYMIRYSDNNALEALVSSFDSEPFIREILSDLGLSFEQVTDSKNPDFISPKTYALLFRILRNGTYLNRDNSEKALKLLSETKFMDGLVKGVNDSTITIAHKYGERNYTKNGKEENELHDCGIVYHPEKPYLLCIMTKGQDFEALKTVIQNVTGVIHESL